MLNTHAPLKSRITPHRPLLGSFVFSTDPSLTEVYAAAGFDFVIIDMEHGLNDVASAAAHVRAARGAGIHALVRVGPADLANIPRLLDAGSEGVMIPHFGLQRSGSTEALQATRFPPLGSRPTCTGVLASGFGLSNFATYAEQSNRDVLTIGLVEDCQCVDNIDAILKRGEVEWLMPGPGDLASSLGFHGQLRHPEVERGIDRIFSSARDCNIPIGMYINDPRELAQWRAKGAQFFILSIDLKWLGHSLKAAAEACRAAA